MNLLENYIIEVVGIKEVTTEWEESMRMLEPNFVASEPMLKVTCLENCYGNHSIREHIWRKSELDKYQKQGYYMS